MKPNSPWRRYNFFGRRKASLEPVSLSSKAQHPVSDTLQARQREARSRLPAQNCKRLIEPQPDFGELKVNK